MTTKLDSVRDELAEYFSNPLGGHGPGVSAQSYDPHGGGFDPATDMRLVNLLRTARGQGRSNWGRIKRIVDELPPAVVATLRLALTHHAYVGARLPEALRLGRAVAEGETIANELVAVERVARLRGLSGMAVAQRVLEVEADYRSGRRSLRLDPRTVEATTLSSILHGVIDVRDATDAVIDQAVDAYVAARAAVGGMKRSHKARLRREREALLDEMLGKVRAKEARRFERRLRGAAA